MVDVTRASSFFFFACGADICDTKNKKIKERSVDEMLDEWINGGFYDTRLIEMSATH
jgi:hypothetical protein